MTRAPQACRSRPWLSAVALAAPATLAALSGCSGNPPPTSAPAPAAPHNAVETSLFLIGDAGEPAPDGEPVLAALRAAVATAAAPVVVFLGDNIYPRGLPDSTHRDRAEAERRIATQIAAVHDLAPVLILPGNHDWGAGADDGWEAVRRQERFVAARGNARLAPGGGCPGPVVMDLGSRLRLVVLDTEWWLRTGPKPTAGDGQCTPDTPAAVTDSIRGALRGAGDRVVAVLGHHPLASGGPHGGHFTWKDHIFPLTAAVPWLWLPLPIIGSLYPLARQAGWSDQDMSGGRNEVLRDSLVAALGARRPLLYAGGHEHNLQVIDGTGARYLVVSGAGRFGQGSHVTTIPGTRFASSAAGFVRVDVLRDGRVRLAVITTDRDGIGSERYSAWLDVAREGATGGDQH